MADQSLDTTRPLIMASAQLVNGHRLERSESVQIVDDETDERGRLTADQATRLHGAGLLVYADRAVATPVETPEQYAARVTEVDDLGKGKFLIRAPWLGEGEEVDEKKLPDRLAEVIQTGAEGHRELIDDVGADGAAAIMSRTDGFSVEDKGNGNFEITGPGIEEPLKIRGAKNAEDKLAELRTQAATQTTTAATTTTVEGAGTAEVVQPGGPAGVSDPAPPVTDTPAD